MLRNVVRCGGPRITVITMRIPITRKTRIRLNNTVFFWSHLSWFLANKNFRLKKERIKDWLQYPELKLLDRFDVVAPLALALGLFALGAWLEYAAPHLQTNGLQLFIWGFCDFYGLALPHDVYRELLGPRLGQAALFNQRRQP